MPLTFSEKERIQKQVVLAEPAPPDESQEAAQFRAGVQRDFEKALADGIMLIFPKE